ncbi:glycosyl hydrolase family 39 [Motilibacter peucedani]|uniref:Glycosyl hydrolase family 39 n=2 Tax=Motilibacter peucedani TaxID=598650 RepID=A0A420XQY1_9ACTN|nr:glycosyl hydrolase family 39 [Motilibacter peucedani]
MRVRRPIRLVAAAVSFAVGGSLAVASATPALAVTKPAPVVKPVATPVDYFGMHVSNLGVARYLPSKATVGSVRLWDTGTTWADVQPTPTTWNWTRLDAAVAQAVRNHQKPMIVLGQTPAWASSQPTLDLGKGLPAGSTATPSHLTYWRAYVDAVVARYYRKGVREFQTWNEPNGGLFFTGTPTQMASLNLAAYQALHAGTVVKTKKRVKGRTVTVSTVKRKYPLASLVGPGFTSRRAPAITWMSKYLASTGGKYADINAVHLYSNPGKGPEDAIAQLVTVRRYLKKYKLDTLPVYATEVSFGGPVGGIGAPEKITEANQAAYVSRFLLLARAQGVARTYWYAWDVHGRLGVELTKADNRTLTPAGKAYSVTRTWMAYPLVDCTRARTNTYTCTIKLRRGHGYIVWNPTKRVGMLAPAGTVSVTSVLGVKKKTKAKAKLVITSSPQYIASTV